MMHGTRRFVECLDDVDDDINQSRENIAITIHDTLITHAVVLHLASGIHTQAFCFDSNFSTTSNSSMTDRVQKITHHVCLSKKGEANSVVSTTDMRPYI
jgi:hypothetical protein